MSKHIGEHDAPPIGARVLTSINRHGNYATNDITILDVQRNSITGNIEIWADQYDARTARTGRTMANIRLGKADALALAEALYSAAQEA